MSHADRRAPDPARVLHLVVPAMVDDPSRPSGGNVYDRELARALRSHGHEVREHLVGGDWADPVHPSVAELDEVLTSLPDHATALVDGLLGLGAPDVMVRAGRRLRVWLLVHLPLGLDTAASTPAVRAGELRALTAATGAIVTSSWTRDWLVTTYGLDPSRVCLARPGVHHAEPATTAGAEAGSLLCVGAVVPGKGQDVLLDALAIIGDLPWSCRLVGPVDREPAFVERLRARIRDCDLSGRVWFTGPLPRAAVDAALTSASLLVQPSRMETYGMVVTEALAHGVPVVASDAGGLVEALGAADDGQVPGVLVPPGEAPALADALRRWLEDAGWRAQLRRVAGLRRAGLHGWPQTAQEVRRALQEVPLNRRPPPHVVKAWP